MSRSLQFHAGAFTVIDNLLLVGRDSKVAELARTISTSIYSADDIAEASEILKLNDTLAILIDPTISPDTACYLAREFRKQDNLMPIIYIGNRASDTEEAFCKAGGTACADRNISEEQLLKLLGQSDNKNADKQPPSCRSLDSIIGTSSAINNAKRMIRMVAQSGCNPVLVLGETGTGKELAARSIHELRHGDAARFVAVNCAALTANLLESELFGHVKGAFTGADAEKTGLLELAGKGTIFLDEISEMPLDLQAKLLRVLQERNFRKVGGTTEISCKATIIASSNRNLLTEVNENRFRRDLYYRLNVCPIILPPLRSQERKADIPILAEHFLRTSDICPEKSKSVKGITNLALELLMRHSWPGNARELKNVIDRAVLLEPSDRISSDSIVLYPDNIKQDTTTAYERPITDFSLEKAEQELITRALQETGWQKSRAASLLGITRATLYAKVKQYSIQQNAPETCEVGT